MYATQRYTPRSPRTVSFGAAVALNGLLIAGLLTVVPDMVQKKLDGPLTTWNVPVDVPPPPIPDEKPKAKQPAQETLLYVPPTAPVRADQPRFETTDTLPVAPPLPSQPEILPPGPSSVTEKPAPPPPLIGAQQDSRYANDFQPDYPGVELRAQRDGQVSIRVLIGADGRVKAVEQVSATSAAFFDTTRRQALAKWRFKPATRGGVPQESWKVMNVRFELKNI